MTYGNFLEKSLRVRLNRFGRVGLSQSKTHGKRFGKINGIGGRKRSGEFE